MAIDFENMGKWEYIIVFIIILQFLLTIYLAFKVSKTNEGYDTYDPQCADCSLQVAAGQKYLVNYPGQNQSCANACVQSNWGFDGLRPCSNCCSQACGTTTAW